MSEVTKARNLYRILRRVKNLCNGALRYFPLALIVALPVGCSGTGQGITPPRVVEKATVLVSGVTDGGTVRISRPIKYVVGGEKKHITRVRYIGIDTLKSDDPLYKAARELNKSLVYRKRVRLEFDEVKVDSYRRILAYVYVGDLFVNAEMIRRGYARVYYGDEANTRHIEQFEKLEEEAKEHKRGIWQHAPGEKPKDDQKRATTPIEGEGTYMASKNSDVFHLSSCSWAKRISERNRLYFRTFREAFDSGRRPCKVCNPGPEDDTH